MLEIRLAEVGGEGATGRERLAHDVFSRAVPAQAPAAPGARARSAAARRCCSSTSSIAPTSRSRPSCSRCSRDFQITVPELGTVRAEAPPIVVITSNRTREIHDALKRRCFYHWIGYPDAARELAILRRALPRCRRRSAGRSSPSCSGCATLDLFKAPGRRRDHRLGAGAGGARPRRRSIRRPSTPRWACSSSTRTTSPRWRGRRRARCWEGCGSSSPSP